MKTFKQFIAEAKQVGTLYHYTSPDGADRILNSDRFGSEHNGYNSFTRNKNFHKHAVDYGSKKSVNGVRTEISFEVDGDKLSNNHKITPDSFYGRLSQRSIKTHSPSQKYKLDPDTDEQEEFINKHIKNAKSYIKKIRIHHPLSIEHMNKLSKHGIPIEHVK